MLIALPFSHAPPAPLTVRVLISLRTVRRERGGYRKLEGGLAPLAPSAPGRPPADRFCQRYARAQARGMDGQGRLAGAGSARRRARLSRRPRSPGASPGRSGGGNDRGPAGEQTAWKAERSRSRSHHQRPSRRAHSEHRTNLSDAFTNAQAAKLAGKRNGGDHSLDIGTASRSHSEHRLDIADGFTNAQAATEAAAGSLWQNVFRLSAIDIAGQFAIFLASPTAVPTYRCLVGPHLGGRLEGCRPGRAPGRPGTRPAVAQEQRSTWEGVDTSYPSTGCRPWTGAAAGCRAGAGDHGPRSRPASSTPGTPLFRPRIVSWGPSPQK